MRPRRRRVDAVVVRGAAVIRRVAPTLSRPARPPRRRVFAPPMRGGASLGRTPTTRGACRPAGGASLLFFFFFWDGGATGNVSRDSSGGGMSDRRRQSPPARKIERPATSRSRSSPCDRRSMRAGSSSADRARSGPATAIVSLRRRWQSLIDAVAPSGSSFSTGERRGRLFPGASRRRRRAYLHAIAERCAGPRAGRLVLHALGREMVVFRAFDTAAPRP